MRRHKIQIARQRAGCNNTRAHYWSFTRVKSAHTETHSSRWATFWWNSGSFILQQADLYLFSKGGGRRRDARTRFSCCRTMQPTYYCMVIHCIILDLLSLALTRVASQSFAISPLEHCCTECARRTFPLCRKHQPNEWETPALLDTEEDNECSRFIADKIYVHILCMCTSGTKYPWKAWFRHKTHVLHARGNKARVRISELN